MATRPEHIAPPEIFYDDKEARKYTTSSRMLEIQSKLSERALELLNLPDDQVPRLLLDIGCGSGLSGETLTEAGHVWVGMDISQAMLDVAMEREVEGDLLLSDIGQGLGMRAAVFDGVISISAVQWLCNADKAANDPKKRLKQFFLSLYRCLSRGSRACLQFYPESAQQMEMVSTAAMRAGFSGGLVVDYPHSTRAKKYFLCLTSGPANANSSLPKAKGVEGEEGSEDGGSDGDDEDETTVSFADRQRPSKRRKSGDGRSKGRAWILKKKEQRRNRGYASVPSDSKYTGRKRKVHF